MKTLEIKRAARNLNANDKIFAFEAIKNSFIQFMNEELSTIEVDNSDYKEPIIRLIYKSTINGQNMEGIEFIKNSSFFYGMGIKSIEIFEKSYTTFEEESNNIVFVEYQNDWTRSIDEDVVLSGKKEPCHYDMALINGRFWTFAPNLTEIREIAFQA